MAVSAIKATLHGMINTADGQQEVIKGRDETGKVITLYPGDVPSHLPDAEFWRQQGFGFPAFAPPSQDFVSGSSVNPQERLYPHIRLDHLLEFLLGDKLA